MNIATQTKLVLLHSLFELGGSATKQEVLSHIQNKNYWKYNDKNDILLTTRNEMRWRNNFSYERDHLKREGYIDSSAKGIWATIDSAKNYFETLEMEVTSIPYKESFVFTKIFYQNIANNFFMVEMDEDENLIRNINIENFNAENSIELDNFPKPKINDKRINNRNVYIRNPAISKNALNIAKNRCEANGKHESFLRGTANVLYMEPHHLIPMSKTDDYDFSLDREQNIGCLCSNCHNLLHYGNMKSIKDTLTILYNKKQSGLNNIIGKEITLEYLFKIYGVE